MFTHEQLCDFHENERHDLRGSPGLAGRDRGCRYLPLGPLHLPGALGIAAAKAVLIGLFFMHLYDRNRVTWVVSIAALFWLGILLPSRSATTCCGMASGIPGKRRLKHRPCTGPWGPGRSIKYGQSVTETPGRL